jgi:hypothetical protein
MFTLNWSILDLIGYNTSQSGGNLSVLFFTGPKDRVELQLRVSISVIAFVLIVIQEIHSTYNVRKFRDFYFKSQGQEWMKNLGGGVRINVLFARRHLYFPFCRIFHWIWAEGYKPSLDEPSSHLGIHLWLTEWQGVCGRALRGEATQVVDFHSSVSTPLTFTRKWLLANQFHFFPWQLSKIASVKVVLSIPMFWETSPGVWQTVGVINLEGITDEGAERLRLNAKELAECFMDHGKILAGLRW